MSQFGHARDDWGNWFGCNNPNPIFHYVLEDKYLRRNPYLKPPAPKREIIVGKRHVVPLSEVINHCSVPQDYPGRISSACGVTIYRDELLGAEYHNSSFTAEPYHNLVHRRVLKPDGVTFSSHRSQIEQDTEFFRSDDPWCRPTYVQAGPDGALYLADMYRQVIEHPEWIDDALEKKLDLGAGRNRGRIWRVAPQNSKPRRLPLLNQLSIEELVMALDCPNSWQRDLAQNMLIWRGDQTAAPRLLDLIKTTSRPQTRLQAMYALEGLHSLPSSLVVDLLSDTHPGVRRHAIRIAEFRLAGSPEMGPALLKLIDDTNPQIQLQLAYSLGEWDDERAARGLARLAVRNQDDPYQKAAVLSSLKQSNIRDVLTSVMAFTKGEASGDLLADLFSQVAALAEPDLIGYVIGRLGLPQDSGLPQHSEKFSPWRLSALSEVLNRMESRKLSLQELTSDADRRQMESLFREARHIVARQDSNEHQLVPAVRLLRDAAIYGTNASSKEDLIRLKQLIGPQQSVAIQLVAIESLGRVNDPSVPRLLLQDWGRQTPRIRRAVLREIIAREEWIPSLLDQIESENLHSFSVDASVRDNLINHRRQSLASRAAQLLGAASASTRTEVLQKHAGALETAGNVANGRLLFGKHCSACHRLEEVGQNVGPDLTVITDRSPTNLLTAILDPNRAVEDKYLTFSVETKDGRLTSGILMAETGASVTLRTSDGREQVIPRTDIDELIGTRKSMMPEGLERELNDQALADIIAYLQVQGAPADK